MRVRDSRSRSNSVRRVRECTNRTCWYVTDTVEHFKIDLDEMVTANERELDRVRLNNLDLAKRLREVEIERDRAIRDRDAKTGEYFEAKWRAAEARAHKRLNDRKRLQKQVAKLTKKLIEFGDIESRMEALEASLSLLKKDRNKALRDRDQSKRKRIKAEKAQARAEKENARSRQVLENVRARGRNTQSKLRGARSSLAKKQKIIDRLRAELDQSANLDIE